MTDTWSIKSTIAFGLLFLIGALIILVGPSWLRVVVELGRNIPHNDLEADYITAVIWAFFLGCGIWWWPVSQQDRTALIWGWIIKVVVTLGFMLIVEGFYSDLDGFYYFENPRSSSFEMEGFTTTNGTTNLMSISWLHQQLIPDSYHSIKVSLSMVGFIAIFIFYRTAVMFFGQDDRRMFFVLLLYPSILFWSSLLGKEPLILLGVAIYAYGVASWMQHSKPSSIAIIVVGMALALYIRFWYATILGGPLVVLVLANYRGFWLKVIVLALVAIFVLIAKQNLADMFSITKFDDVVEQIGVVTENFNFGGSATESVELGSVTDIVFFLPIGIFTSIYRPLPGEVGNMFGIMAGLENTCLLFASIIAVLNWWKTRTLNLAAVWAFTLLALWVGIYGIISYGNMGTAVRYKLPILPIIIGLLIYLCVSKAPAKIALSAKHV